jgi:hypothetical protein
MLTMKIRTLRLVAVLSHVFAAKPTTEPGTWDCISTAIKAVAAQPAPVGNNHHLIRRDVLHMHGYPGQAQLVMEILSAVHVGNADIFSRHLPPESIRQLNQVIQPGQPSQNVTRAWFEQALKQGLLKRLVQRIKMRFPSEDVAEINSMANLSIARWCNKDMLKIVLDKGIRPSEKVLANYLVRNLTSEFMARGVDAHCRARNRARTAAELRGRDLGNLSPENPYKIIIAPGSDMTPDQHESFDFEDQQPNAEHRLCEVDLLAEGSAIIESIVPKGGLRRSQILEAVLAGAERQDMMRTFDLTETRVNHLTAEVRQLIRQGELLVQQAQSVSDLLTEEPWSSVNEIMDDLSLTKKQTKTVLRYMLKKGLIRPSADKKCYALTHTGADLPLRL